MYYKAYYQTNISSLAKTHQTWLASQEKMWNLGMSFARNLTCSWEIFHSNTITIANF